MHFSVITFFSSVQTFTYSKTTGTSKAFKMNSKLQPDDSINVFFVTKTGRQSHF